MGTGVIKRQEKFYSRILVPKKPNNLCIKVTASGNMEVTWKDCLCENYELELFKSNSLQSLFTSDEKVVVEHGETSKFMSKKVLEGSMYHCTMYAINVAGKSIMAVSNIFIAGTK